MSNVNSNPFLREEMWSLFEDVSKERSFQKNECFNSKNLCTTTWRTTGYRRLFARLENCENGNLRVEFRFLEVPDNCHEHIEFRYRIRLIHKFSMKICALQFSGKAITDEKTETAFVCYHKLPIYHKLRGVSFKNIYMQLGVAVYVYYDKDGIRNLILSRTTGKAKRFFTARKKAFYLPMNVLKPRAPLLLKAIEADGMSETTENHLKLFIQLLIQVQVQLKQENIKPLLEMATEYEAWNVKKYCELQLIWRDDFELSERQKFKLACEFNLNILMNQLLKDVKTVKKLAELVKYTTEINSMDSNVSKLLIGKMYEL